MKIFFTIPDPDLTQESSVGPLGLQVFPISCCPPTKIKTGLRYSSIKIILKQLTQLEIITKFLI